MSDIIQHSTTTMGENDGVPPPFAKTILTSSPIAFHCMSVIAQEPNFKSLLSDPYSNRVIHGVLSECLEIARRQNCTFPKSKVNDIISSMTENFPPPNDTELLDSNLFTTMYQDLLANRPLEFEVYLGNPVRM